MLGLHLAILLASHISVGKIEPESFGRARSSVSVGLSRQLFLARRLRALNSHWLFWSLVHVELKDIRPRIMAYNVQVVFAPDYLRAIDLGDQNLLDRMIIRRKVASAVMARQLDGKRVIRPVSGI